MHEGKNLNNPGGNASPATQVTGSQSLDFFYPCVFETIPHGIWIMDTQGITSYVNEGMAALLGSTVKELKQQTRLQYLFEEDQESASSFLQSPSQHTKEEFECRFKQPNGSFRWLHVINTPARDEKGNWIGTVSIHTDITERIVLGESLEKSQENLRVIVDSVKDYAIMTIDKDRHILTWNAGARAIFGYTEQEITGQLSDIFFTPEDIHNRVPEKEVESALTTGHAFDDRWHRRKDGSRFYASGVLTPIIEEGKPTKFIKICRDWTERKKVEEMLRKADRHKNEFLATLAHELRNPLASIHSGMEVLENELDEKSRKQTVKTIERQVQQMIHLINDLLDISRISQGKIKLNKQPLNLIDPINLALESTRAIIDGYKHSLTVALPNEPLVVDADLTRISQVFLNILINAAKYTPPGGTITFAVSRQDDEVLVRVRDNGKGIPSHMLSTIFEMFEQVQDRSEYPQAGLGIGLSVVKQLVEMHDGYVEAYSEGENMGTEFLVKLPLCKQQRLPEQNEADGGETQKPHEPQPRNRRVLIVDDNSDAADMMEILLKKKGFSIQKAYDGRSGISAAIEFDPEIVLLDIGLPDIDGYAVVKTLQEKLGKRLFIALSGWGQDEDLIRSKEAGFDHHLVKPVDIQTVEKLLMTADEDVSH